MRFCWVRRRKARFCLRREEGGGGGWRGGMYLFFFFSELVFVWTEERKGEGKGWIVELLVEGYWVVEEEGRTKDREEADIPAARIIISEIPRFSVFVALKRKSQRNISP